jgi:23S rRNA (cytosine1962-C5)-methyltransferase
MIAADLWRDYELLDCSDGERLERWGKYILVRPDPQVIWRGRRVHPLWKSPDAVYTRSKSGGGSWNGNSLPAEWNISYGNLTFSVKPMGFKHTGLFPEQAANWERFMPLIMSAGRPVRVLNLFAYTGGATVAAASAGAEVCHVDAAKNMVARARENAELSGLGSARIRYIVDDCSKFVEREVRRGSFYDAVIMDPPSYGRGPSGELWKLEDSVDSLISSAAGLLSKEPLFFLVSSYTAGLSPSTIGYILNCELVPRFGGRVVADELGLPVTQTGGLLPCGSAAMWMA